MRSVPTMLLLSAFLAGQALAVGESLPPQTVSEIATGWGQEGIYIVTRERIQSANSNCGTNTNYIIRNDNPYQDKMLSILLAAQSTKAKVILYVDGCASNSMRLEAVNIQTQ